VTTGPSPDPASPFATTWKLYVDYGWQGPIPVDYLDKQPPPDGFTGFDGKWPTAGRLERWAEQGPRNIALRLPDDVIGIDVDNYAKLNKKGVRVVKSGAAQLAEFEATHGNLPPTWSSTKRDPTGASRIHFYRVPAGTTFPESIAADIDIIQFGHRYAVVYPSVMADDDDPEIVLIYSWFDPDLVESPVPPSPEDLTTLPLTMVEAMQAAGPIKSKEDGGKTAKSTGLGLYLPSDDPGRTNEWLTKVAGRLAIAFRHSRAEYLEVMKLVDASSADPHALADLEKTAMSVWSREQGKQIPGAGTSAAGFLFSQSGRIMSTSPSGEEYEFADFDVRVTGKVRSADGTLDGYDVRLTDSRTRRESDAYLPVTVLSDPRRLGGWLARYEIGIVAATFPGQAQHHARLRSYLSAQSAPDIRVVPFWGWDDQVQGFVTDRGVIRSNGLETDRSVRPDPELIRRNLIHHRYGFDFAEDQVRSILREVLTFQDDTVASVVGAWWMATKLKGQIMHLSSLFPVMVVESASGSGKSTGFFEFIYALDGNTQTQSVPSPAAFVRRVGAHRNGYVWMDDPDDLTPKHRTAIRVATGEDQLQKSEQDNQSIAETQLVAPIMLSGEGFGLNSEKALPDRVIQISLPDSKSRMSLHDPSRRQWDDILDFRRAYPDLTMAAGTLVAMALQFANIVEQLPDLRVGDARHGDKMAVLRVGARILAAVTEDPTHIDRVDEWCGVQVDRGNENALTRLLVPTCLDFMGEVAKPVVKQGPPFYGLPTPVVVRPNKDGVMSVWVSPEVIAQWWERHSKRGVEVRTHTIEALKDQAHALNMKGQTGVHNVDFWRPRIDMGDDGVRQVTYWRIPDRYAVDMLGAGPEDGAEVFESPMARVLRKDKNMRRSAG
jgi:hypothetical protein